MEENKEVDYSYVTFYRDKTGEVLRYKFGRCLSDCTSDFKVYLDENKNLIQLYKNNKRITWLDESFAANSFINSVHSNDTDILLFLFFIFFILF